jgi:integrase
MNTILFATAAHRHRHDPARDWATWKRLLEQAGVPHARLHDARHTAATLLLAQGTPARVAMEILGHSQIGLTLDTYSHVVPEMQRDAADRIGNALWGPDGDVDGDDAN